MGIYKNLWDDCKTTIHYLPNEIMEMIFKEMESLKDVRRCSNTCKKWKNIISKMFMNKAIILLTTGRTTKQHHYENRIGPSSEIIDLMSPKFKYEFHEDDLARSISSGGILQDQPIICGGTDEDGDLQDSVFLGHPNKTLHPKLLEERVSSSSLVVNSNTIWITGGLKNTDNSAYSLNTTEFIKLDGSVLRGPILPITISDHCMIQLNYKKIFMIGGFQNGSTSNKTWIVDPCNNYKIKEGPPLNKLRVGHSSAKMKLNGKTVIVVAGGFEEDSVEILDPSSGKGWIYGPKLPMKLYGSAMVTSPTGKGVILTGGSSKVKNMLYCKAILLELSGRSFQTLKWTALDQKLKYPRGDHLALLISEEVLDNLESRYGFSDESSKHVSKQYRENLKSNTSKSFVSGFMSSRNSLLAPYGGGAWVGWA